MPDTTNNGTPSFEAGRKCTVIWDFDGTLVDSRQKNLKVTRAIIEEATGRPWQDFEALQSLPNYDDAHRRVENWKVFYADAFGMSAADIDRVGYWWSRFQMDDDTLPAAFDGIPETLKALSHLQHGIVSQNSRLNIASILKGIELDTHFQSIIGYEEVGLAHQKPAPEGLLQCIDHLTAFDPGVVLFIGDHVTDAICAARTRDKLAAQGHSVRVASVRAAYGPGDFHAWSIEPDHVAHHPEEVVDIISNYMVS